MLSPEEAKDAVQETKLRFLTVRSTGQEISNEKAFLLGILKNVIREIQRQKNVLGGLPPDVMDPDESAETNYIRQEEIQILRDSFAELDPYCQQLLKLHSLEEKSYSELERLMSGAHATLHRHFRKCSEKFKKILKKRGITCESISLFK